MRASYWCITFVKVTNILKVTAKNKKLFLEFQIPQLDNLLTAYLLVKTKNNYLVLVYVESYVARHKKNLPVNIQWKSENIWNFLLLVITRWKYSKYQKANCQALPTGQADVSTGRCHWFIYCFDIILSRDSYNIACGNAGLRHRSTRSYMSVLFV